MDVTQLPSRTELVERASAIGPTLRANIAWGEQNRRLHEETVEALTEAGVFRLMLPARYGGYEAGTRTAVEVLGQVAEGDPSAAWIGGVNAITTFMTSLLPDEVQDEVFGNGDARLCGTLSPTGMCMPVEGGMMLSGKWGFISGAQHATWQVIVAVAPAPSPPGEFWPIMTVVPMSELQIIDDWETSGLRGTGSVSTAAENVFVPAQRILPLPLVLAEQYASATNAASPVYRTPLLPTASALSVGPVWGLARAAKREFLDRLPGRKITYTAYDNQHDAPITHLQVAEGSLLIDEVGFHARSVADLVDGKGADGSAWTPEERARARAGMGRAVRLAKSAVDVFGTASGGSSIYTSVPIQRLVRDIHAVNLHGLMHPDTNDELYGRILCGLAPNTLYF
ncbi:acyl-CoA dehydrogenase family protein [Micromonospora mangrovi]|uniref:Acyl-CoA dehydrogenase family protein n=2 Tax=Micromonospora TaxID=1873 RepID=A0AAU8HFN8_9ACTN